MIPGQIALAWLLHKGSDVAPIPGTKRRRYLEENVHAANVSLNAEEMARLDATLSPEKVSGPRYNEKQMSWWIARVALSFLKSAEQATCLRSVNKTAGRRAARFDCTVALVYRIALHFSFGSTSQTMKPWRMERLMPWRYPPCFLSSTTPRP